MSIVGYSSVADVDAMELQEWMEGAAWHDAGNGYVEGASCAWRWGWKFAYHRFLVSKFRVGRNWRHVGGNNRYWLRYHLSWAKQYNLGRDRKPDRPSNGLAFRNGAQAANRYGYPV